MPIPFFYIEEILSSSNSIILNEQTSKHIIQVLRMKSGEQVNLTDGKGNLYNATIINDSKKNCEVSINSTIEKQSSPHKISIAISILKNPTRFEWFLEKATEIGVQEIVPLLCERTERAHFRYERINGILISAMLQSQQTWLPVLHQPTKFSDVITTQSDNNSKFIAQCEEQNKQSLTNQLINKSTNQLILIGPEGDFTKQEIPLH